LKYAITLSKINYALDYTTPPLLNTKSLKKLAWKL